MPTAMNPHVVNPRPLVEFGVASVEFLHVAEDWHGLAGYGVLYCHVVDSMYINLLWIYNCGNCILTLSHLYVVKHDVLLLNGCNFMWCHSLHVSPRGLPSG